MTAKKAKKGKRSRRILLILGIIIVVLLVVLVIGKNQGLFGSEGLTKVAVEKGITREIVEIITANGKIQPETEVIISPDVSGEIVELVVKEGDVVEKGQYQADLNKVAEAFVETMEEEIRLERLVNQNN